MGGESKKGGERESSSSTFATREAQQSTATHHAPSVVQVGRGRRRPGDVLEQLGDVAIGVRPVSFEGKGERGGGGGGVRRERWVLLIARCALNEHDRKQNAPPGAVGRRAHHLGSARVLGARARAWGEKRERGGGWRSRRGFGLCARARESALGSGGATGWWAPRGSGFVGNRTGWWYTVGVWFGVGARARARLVPPTPTPTPRRARSRPGRGGRSASAGVCVLSLLVCVQIVCG
jgi:hypothetical protein